MQLKRYSRFLFLVFVFSLPPYLQAQDTGNRVSTGEDTIQVNRLMKRAAIARGLQPDSAIILLQQSLRISRMLHYEDGMAGSLLSMAFCYQDKGAYEKTKELLRAAYPHCVNVAPHNKKVLPSLYNGWGGTYNFQGDNDSALHFYYKALSELAHNGSGDSSVLVQVYGNIGTSWMQKGELKKCLQYLRTAELIGERTGDTIALGDIYINSGITHLAMADTAQAIQYLKSAQQFLLKRPQNRSIKYVYYAMGNAQSDPLKALTYYQTALSYDSTSGFGAGMYQNIGSVYYRLGDFKNAAPYYLKAQQICEKEGLSSHRIANYSALSSINEHLGRYKEAYRYQVAYADLKDSLLNVEKEKAVHQLELKFKTAEKDKALAQNKTLLYKLQRRFILIAACGLLLLGIVIAVWRSSRSKQKLQAVRIRNFEQQQKIEHLHSKMQGEEEERSRIARELHDGVNVLLSATKMNYAALGKEYKGLHDTQTYGEIMQLLNHMGLELRTITYKLVPELLIQQSLPDAIETFCELIQKGNQLHIELQTYGSFSALQPEFCFAVYRIVQELVHNIVKHSGATQVLIALVYQDDLLQLTVEDNGNGFDTEKATRGIGMESIRSRVRDLGGQVTFSSCPGEGTSVEMEVSTLANAKI